MVLRLTEHTGKDNDLYDRLSGAFFLGCLHDERGLSFCSRIYWTILKELGYLCRDNEYGPKWEPLVKWVGSVTKKFRWLKLPFPVWTYCESVSTIYRREYKLFKGPKELSEIVRTTLIYFK